MMVEGIANTKVRRGSGGWKLGIPAALVVLFGAVSVPASEGERPLLAGDTTSMDDGSMIDLMVVYTAQTRAAAGGSTSMNSQVDLAVADLNAAYTNSGINPRMRLVYRAR